MLKAEIGSMIILSIDFPSIQINLSMHLKPIRKLFIEMSQSDTAPTRLLIKYANYRILGKKIIAYQNVYIERFEKLTKMPIL